MTKTFNRKKAQNEPQGPKQQTCQAAGCELFGTRSATLAGSDKWYCRFHHGQSLSNFNTVTDRIQKARPLIDHIHRLERARPDEILARSPVLFHYLRNERFSAEEGEPYGDYLARLKRFLANYVRDGLQQHELEEAKGLVNSLVEETKATPTPDRQGVQRQAAGILEAEAKRKREAAKKPLTGVARG